MTEKSHDLSVYVINLEDESVRYKKIFDALSPFEFLSVMRIDAVRGSLIPDLAAIQLTKNKWSVEHKGTLGCFLSHVRAWEIISASTTPFSVILEDDVSFGQIELLNKLSIPTNADLIFCNDRTYFAVEEGAASVEKNKCEIQPFAPVLGHLVKTRQANGGDGYLLTPKGARRLLEFVEKDSFFGHVDLRMATYSITRQEAEPYADSNWATTRNICAMRRTYPESHKLCTYVMVPPVVFHGKEPSRRAREDARSAAQKNK